MKQLVEGSESQSVLHFLPPFRDAANFALEKEGVGSLPRPWEGT